jgi:hypothetical protein
MRKNEIMSLRYMATARRANSFLGVTIVKHYKTLIAEAPVGLCCEACRCVVMKDEIVPLRDVSAACRTKSFWRESIVKHAAALVTETPILLRV